MYDHEIKIGSTTKRLNLIRQEGRALYNVTEDVPQHQDPLLFTQNNWIGGHGQYDFNKPDMYFEGENIDTTQEGVVFLGPLINEVKKSTPSDLDSAPVCFAWFNAVSKWLVATAGHIYIYNSGNNNWVIATNTVAGVTGFCEYQDVMYACVGTSTKYYYSTDASATTWTQTDLDDGYAEKMMVAPNVAGTADILWKFKQPNEVRYTTDGRTVAGGGSQWSSVAYVGDKSNNITSLFLLGDKFMVGREDGLFQYDSAGGIHQWKSDLAHNRSANNFKYVVEWRAGKYFSLAKGIGEIIAKNYDNVGPLTGIDDIGKVGDCVGLASEEKYLYIAEDEGDDVIIYKCKDSIAGGELHWEYCPWIKLDSKACATIKVCQHSATDKRLWFGYGVNTGYVKLTDNPLATGSGAEFNTDDGFIRMSYTYGTNQYWDKMFQTIVTETAGCSASVNVQPMYRRNTDSSATNLTTAIITNGTVRTNLTSAAVALSNKRIQFELHLVTNSSAATPEVRFFQARGNEKPETFRTHECTYSIGDKPTQGADTIRTFLRGGRTSTTLVRFADLRYGDKTSGTAGTDFEYVVIPPGYPREVEITHTRGRHPELGLEVKFKEVNYS